MPIVFTTATVAHNRIYFSPTPAKYKSVTRSCINRRIWRINLLLFEFAFALALFIQ